MHISTRLTAVTTLLVTAALFTFTACRKDRTKDTDEDTGYATEHATLEKTFSDAQSITDEAGENGGLSAYKMTAPNTVLGSCATITNDTTVTPHKLTVDFGAVNCVCNDGVSRRGKIIVTYTGRYKDAGHSHTITFDSYFANDNGVSGSKTVTNTGSDAAGNPKYDITVNGAIVLANGNGTVSWVSARTRTWLSGFTTADWRDDVYEISGTGTVTRASGKTFDISITTPLHVALACRWIESGVVSITPQGGNTRTLDYGNGNCDALATFTVNGNTRSITLK